MSRLAAVVFDMDGVLIDSEPLWQDAEIEVFGTLGVALTRDLIALARYLLVPGGRLVFFLPTVTEEYKGIDIPTVDGMRELKVGDGSVQEFGQWSRRVSLCLA